MIYAPHNLQKKTITESTDEFGHHIKDQTTWDDICPCRCDDNTSREFKSQNGDVFMPLYHIVCSGRTPVKKDDEVRCLNADGTERGSGKVYLYKYADYLNYTELYVI